MIETVPDVVEALGGTFKAAAIASVGPSAVSNWIRRGSIPSDRFFIISDALRGVGKEVSPNLFGFAVPEAATGEVQ